MDVTSMTAAAHARVLGSACPSQARPRATRLECAAFLGDTTDANASARLAPSGRLW